MGRGLLAAAVATLVMVLGFAAQASADETIGTTTQPGGSGPDACTNAVTWVQTGTAHGGPSYVVPAGGGQITSWSTNTGGDAGGTQVSLVVLRPASGGNYTVMAVDTETLTSPLPPVATFTLASPIVVSAGDTIGIAASSLGNSSANTCLWSGGGSLTAADTAGEYSSSPPDYVARGQTLTSYGSAPGFRVDVAATVAPPQDLAVSTQTAPTRPTPGNLALFTSTITNHGPGSYASTFVERLPAGLTISSASAGNGSCGVSGHIVTCAIAGVSAGSSMPVYVVVTPSAAGRYTSQATVANPPGQTDPNPADNSATATVEVTNPPGKVVTKTQPRQCVVPKLKGIRSRMAKRLLKLLGCNVKVEHRRRPGVTKGTVLGTRPGVGSYRFGRKITLVVRK